MSLILGASTDSPLFSKRLPWHGQSHVLVKSFHVSSHPKWVQYFFSLAISSLGITMDFTLSLTMLPTSSRFFTGSSQVASKIESHSFSLPVIMSVMIFAAILDVVIPHFLYPVATYMFSVRLLYFPI